MKNIDLSFKPLSRDNLELICQIQEQIFPGESARKNYIETLEKNPYRKEIANWLVFKGQKPIGIVGLYSYHEYPKTAWLGWFGVIKEERNKGYGSEIFDFWLDYSRKKGYTEARLYTEKDSNIDAIEFYKQKGMIEEAYINPEEIKEITDTTLIFSLSLTDKQVEKWNNKFLELTAQLNKQS